MIRLKIVCIGLVVASAAGAQEAADAITGFQQNAAKRTAEWSALTTSLEQRVARLFPCDPRIRSAIEEVKRASDTRSTAVSTYWMALSGKSKSQIDAITKVLAQEEARREEWTTDRADAEAERTAVTEQNGFLAISANRLPALASAQESLASATRALRAIETQIQAREAIPDQLLGELRDLLAASQARQSAIETHLQFIGAEGRRWSAYYDARLKRAQMECVITNPREAVPFPKAGKKK